jgi:hypothetical protein
MKGTIFDRSQKMALEEHQVRDARATQWPLATGMTKISRPEGK